MGLHLRIENVPNLPDGGPVEITVTGKRGIDIGRDSHLDWSLPDPTRHISGKHAEIRYKEGGYWLHDVSTNGTYLNGGDHRMQAPHRLRSGDRFTIGQYIVVAMVDGEQAGLPPAPQQTPSSYQELGASPAGVPPPIDSSQLKARRDRDAPVNPDFLDWAADVPNPFDAPRPLPVSPMPQSSAPETNMNWAEGPMTPAP